MYADTRASGESGHKYSQMPRITRIVTDPGRLDSWKAIAAYLHRDGLTVRRWERRLGLPVRRLPGGRGASVFAYTAEIDAWLKDGGGPLRTSAPQNASPLRVGWRLPAAAVALAVLAVSGAVVYEFSSRLELVRAEFSARYWDHHRALEAEGKLDHTREECPDRNGPRPVHVWEPGTGWRELRINERW